MYTDAFSFLKGGFSSIAYFSRAMEQHGQEWEGQSRFGESRGCGVRLKFNCPLSPGPLVTTPQVVKVEQH